LSLVNTQLQIETKLNDILNYTCKKFKCTPEYFIEDAIKGSLFGFDEPDFSGLDEIEDGGTFVEELMNENYKKWREIA